MWIEASGVTSECQDVKTAKTDHLKEPFWIHWELHDSFIVYTLSIASRGDHKDTLIRSRNTKKKMSKRSKNNSVLCFVANLIYSFVMNYQLSGTHYTDEALLL